jgi:hypothetical protein
MLLQLNNYELDLLDEPAHAIDPADNVRLYDREYLLAGSPHQIISCHGVILRQGRVNQASCMLLAGGGPTTVHERSAVVVGENCFVAVGDRLCCLALPALTLRWNRKVDFATCFGVYYSTDHNCLLSHGECEIARLSLSGDIAWSAGGADVLTEGFRLLRDHVEVTDFYRVVYRFDLLTGRSEILAAKPPI